MQNVCLQAEKVVSKFEEMGAVTGDLGLSTLALAKFEDTDGSSCGTYTDSAMASKTISADTKRIGSVRFPVPGLCLLAALALLPYHEHGRAYPVML